MGASATIIWFRFTPMPAPQYVEYAMPTTAPATPEAQSEVPFWVILLAPPSVLSLYTKP